MSGQKFSFNMRTYLTILIFISGLNLIESYNYSDTCFYYDYHFRCGDLCVRDITSTCNCGSEQIQNKLSDIYHPHYCCTPPSVKCKKKWYGASCPEGEVLEADQFYQAYPEKFDVDGATSCYGRCYNDYFTSEYLGHKSHFTCPDKCVHWSGMCRGVSWCEGDEEICGEHLRCPRDILTGIVKKHTMATHPPRSYCFQGET